MFSHYPEIFFDHRSAPPVRHKIYSPLYLAPITDRKKLEQMMESGEASKLESVPILPALTTDNNSIYSDPVIKKFTNYLMRDGKKTRAQMLLLKTFERIKRYQLEKYHKEEDPAEKAKIEVDPLKIFHCAIENCKPLLQLTKIKRGGATYQVSGEAFISFKLNSFCTRAIRKVVPVCEIKTQK
ncbi:28S ribosomal protein S7, mitochondrial [Homalodisca vitripennis]|nr:28S ribosomal protein S7, mitochondrial [Homalodisca vitripennis]